MLISRDWVQYNQGAPIPHLELKAGLSKKLFISWIAPGKGKACQSPAKPICEHVKSYVKYAEPIFKNILPMSSQLNYEFLLMDKTKPKSSPMQPGFRPGSNGPAHYTPTFQEFNQIIPCPGCKRVSNQRGPFINHAAK